MRKIRKFAVALLVIFMSSLMCTALVPGNVGMVTSASAASSTILNHTTLTIAPGQKVKLKANTTSKVVWATSSKKIAKVTTSGYVTGAALGTAKIRARVGSKYYYCTIKVVEPDTNDLFLSMAIGEVYTIPLNVSKTGVKWVSSNPYVATVSSKGTVKVLRKGTAKIYAVIGGKQYIQMGVFSVATNDDVSYLQNYSIPDPNGGLPMIIHRSSIANYLADKYDVVDISGYYPENDGTMVDVTAGTLDRSNGFFDRYILSCAALTNTKLKDSGANTIFQKGDKYGNYTITGASTEIAEASVLAEYNYAYSNYAYDYGINYVGISATGIATFKCRIYSDDGPDGGFYIDGKQADSIINKYDIPTVTNNGPIYLNENSSMLKVLEKYVAPGRSAEFTLTIGDISSGRRGVYFDEMGWISADVINIKYIGS